MRTTKNTDRSAITFEIPLHEALAWVITRSEEFLIALRREGNAGIFEFLERYNASRTERLFPFMGSIEQAWAATKKEAILGHVVLRGVAFEKGHHINGPGQFDNKPDDERVIHSGPPRIMPKESLETLIVELEKAEIRLKPNDWFTNGGRWWKHVETDWAPFSAVFKPSSKRKLTPVQQTIVAARRDKWPNGEYRMLRDKEELAAIVEWCKANDKTPPSLTAIQRWRRDPRSRFL